MADLCKVLWAKKDDRQGKGEWLPLMQHLEDTGRVCGFLWDHWLSDGQRQIIANGCDQDTARQVMIFLGAIHDLGKATPAFQIKGSGIKRNDLDLELLERLERSGARGISELKLANGKNSPHNIAGEVLLRYFGERFKYPGDISSIVGGHHGSPISWNIIEEQLIAFKINYFQTEKISDPLQQLWEKSQRNILEWALSFAGFSSAEEIPKLTIPAQVQALGLLTMADWIASNTNYFPLIRLEVEGIFDSGYRFQSGMEKWLQTYGWEPIYFKNVELAFEHRFNFQPRSVQKNFIDTIAVAEQPGLFILEAPMGLGKTEAALMGAEILAYKTERKGLFFGLPTQATSNGIFPRIIKWLQSISKDSGSRSESPRLIHGKANLNPDYQNLTNASHIAADMDGYEGFVTNQWFSGKKTAILDDFVVGTVDQFLLSVLKQKHLALRQLGFARKVVIIDEVHAYDAYMSQYLQMALRWMACYRVPVILLSATLSAKSRYDFTTAYLRGLGVKKLKNITVEGKALEDYLHLSDYPLITYTEGESVQQVRNILVDNTHKITVEQISENDIKKVLDDTFANGGGNIGIIVNTVRHAQELAQELTECYGEDMVELLHSSFLSTERVRKETELMHMLGRGDKVERPKKKIVVGTQVIEQSLDIDFDMMISELAPIDLLIQRLGRLHRHKKNNKIRSVSCKKPKLYLTGCSQELDFQEGSEAIYGGYLLTRSQYFLGEVISLPEDISPLVQAVYGEEEISLPLKETGKYNEYKKKSEERQRRMKNRAKTYLLKKPQNDECTLHDWLEHPTEDQSDENGHSQVRDVDESIEVIAVQKVEEGYSPLFGELSGQDISGVVLDTKVGMQLAGETLRLPRVLCLPETIKNTIRELEKLYIKEFKAWDESGWLKGSLGIMFDQDMNCRLNGYLLHYDRRYGLSYKKEDGGIG